MALAVATAPLAAGAAAFAAGAAAGAALAAAPGAAFAAGAAFEPPPPPLEVSATKTATAATATIPTAIPTLAATCSRRRAGVRVTARSRTTTTGSSAPSADTSGRRWAIAIARASRAAFCASAVSAALAADPPSSHSSTFGSATSPRSGAGPSTDPAGTRTVAQPKVRMTRTATGMRMMTW
ncbi:MAG: hypothetical protein E6J62_15425 [Deltaproteobacteria bacterium]|nr:MAG: hypothetical protein E6J62_15425 [Deltaproteobacteria bacterium]